MNKIKLGDVLEVKRGMSLPGEYYATEGDYIRLTLGNFNYPSCGWKKNVLKDNLFFTGNVRDEYILKKGDIITPLTEQVRGLLGNTATIPEDALYIQSGDIGLIIPDETKLDKRFSYYLVSSSVVKKQLDARSQQTKIRHTSPEAIKDCVAFIPIIKEQKKISYLLDCINKKIENNNAINDNLEAQAEAIYNEMIANNSTNGTMSTLGEISTIKTGKLNSEAAVINGIYPFFTCSQETYRTNTFSFDQEAVLLAGNNASAIYPLKIYCGKFDVYQRTYVISSNNRFVSNKQLYFVLKQQLNEFKGISSGTTTKFLTMKILTPIPVVITPEDIATSFINITNKIFETIFQNQREIEHLRELQMIVLGELSRD